MDRRKYLGLAGTAVAASVAGCTGGGSGQRDDESGDDGGLDSYQKFKTPGMTTVERFVDREAGLVVYVSDEHEAGGIHTVPITETRLG